MSKFSVFIAAVVLLASTSLMSGTAIFVPAGASMSNGDTIFTTNVGFRSCWVYITAQSKELVEVHFGLNNGKVDIIKFDGPIGASSGATIFFPYNPQGAVVDSVYIKFEDDVNASMTIVPNAIR